MGLLPEAFWKLTFAEFYTMAKGYSRRERQRKNELIFTAWHVEAFARTKKMPELASLMISDTPKKKQTHDDMFAMAMMLNAAYGGDVVEV